jgi:hypothetical protein
MSRFCQLFMVFQSNFSSIFKTSLYHFGDKIPSDYLVNETFQITVY